jgi:hypothetical protein
MLKTRFHPGVEWRLYDTELAKPRFLPAADSIIALNSAETAVGDFSQ